MKITAKPSRTLGRRKSLTLAYFNVDSIYLSSGSANSEVSYTERTKILRYTKGLSIKAVSCDGVRYIDIHYEELKGIRVIVPDEFEMPKRDRESLSSVMFGWVQGLSSLHDTRLKIGGRIEFIYEDKPGNQQEIILYHSKQDIFDLFKYMRKHFAKYIL